MKTSKAFACNGRVFKPVDPEAMNLHETLPVGTYSVKVAPTGFYVERVDDMELPPRMYGDVAARTERILTTFNNRPNSLGVLFSGDKGSGKTMLAKNISAEGLKRGIVTLIVNTPFEGEGFNTFIQEIQQPAVVLFDEFEKVYNAEQQQGLLTLLDGTYNSKKLFVLTCNDRWRINEHMRNRPGRLFYSLHYGTLEADFIEEYCRDNLDNKAHINSVAHVASVFACFSFDMLKALVEEMNRYKESAAQAMKWLNMDPAQSEFGDRFNIFIQRDGKLLRTSLKVDKPTPVDTIGRSPMTLTGHHCWINGLDDDEDEDGDNDLAQAKKMGVDLSEFFVGTASVGADMGNLIHADARKGTYVFGTNRPELEMVFVREERKVIQFNYDAF